MPLWTVTPQTSLDDPNWANALVYPHLLVRAETSGQVRAIAAAMEAREAGYHPKGDSTGTQAMDLPSAFLDPKLYKVTRAGDGDGPMGVVERSEPMRGASADAVPG